MKFRLLLVVTLSVSAACTTEEIDSPIVENPTPCPSADPDKEYVGCWLARGCNVYTYMASPDGPEITQWSKTRYYLTADGRLFDFTWRYEQGACSGPVAVYDKGDVIRNHKFIDNGKVTTPSSNNVRKLAVEFPSGDSFDVMVEKLVDGTLCVSNNLRLTQQRYVYSSATDVDYNNCADPIVNSN